MTSMTDLSRQLTRVVSSADGVCEVYPASRFRELMAGTVLQAETQGADVSVQERGGGLDVFANICVDSHYSLPTVLRSVADALAVALAEWVAAAEGDAGSQRHALGTPHIAVTASRIR